MIDTTLKGVPRPVLATATSRSAPVTANVASKPEAGSEVQLSAEGMALSAKATLTQKQLEEKFQRVYGPDSFIFKVNAEIKRLGNASVALNEIPAEASPERLKQSQQAAKYIAGVVRGQRDTANPFAHLSREEVVAILEDESGAYTSVERYAAWEARQDMDNAWVQQNALLRDHESDGRLDVRRTLEFIDNLGELELMRYPPGHRDSIEGLLKQSQTPGGDFEQPKIPSLVDILRQMDESQKAQEPSIEPPD
ncbi:hypothetical protein M2396_001289 [Pseudomonas sp. BIGb0278]|jgi:hypothetical protein|uniref:hypothetical protein n=1 Tax=unclassified Pseudomonas TaxID=196821 RepID=UPI001C73C881|nr:MULTISPECIES: hypothetical protein [unclassified Pseudomonas]MCS4283024.1 hypothetical protein [Pseudomonas sp. BIGb0278]QYX53862.1 hypothetical protein K3F44_06035 [Pseudomonas sp. S07E 245]